MERPNLPILLAYKSPLHDKVRKGVLDRYRMAQRKMQERADQWRKAEDLYLAYIKKTDEDKLRENRREAGKPTYTTICIPYSYALLLTAHTYWSSVFLGRDPVFQWAARYGETQQKTQAVEAVIDYQRLVGGWGPALYSWLLDAGKYGLGILGNHWCEETRMVTRVTDEAQTFLGVIPTGKTKKVTTRERLVDYKGNKLFNIRPYDFFFDPRVPISRLQDGEFAGRRTEVSWAYLKRGEFRPDEPEGYGRYFNLEQLEKVLKSGSRDREYGSANMNLPDDGGSYDGGALGDKGFPELIEMHVDLIPKEWGLGDSDFPEKWIFAIAAKEVIVYAAPMTEDHNSFPYFLQQYEIDAYSHTSRGMLEITKPLNDAMDWLLNSHFFSVRRSLNGNYVVDPSRVVMADLKDGEPGWLLRLRASAYGSDPKTVLHEISGSTPTASHLRDMQVLEMIAQRVTGVTDNIQGLMAGGGRKTATEVRTSTGFGVNRLKTFSEYNSTLGWSPLAKVLLQNTQQFYDEERMLRIAGDLPGAMSLVQVNPKALAGFFDFVPVDGTLPIDRMAQANLWKEILLGMNQMPTIAMSYDLPGIFQWMAQLAGLKNISQFRVQVLPDAQMQTMAASGEAVPAGTALEGVGQTAAGPGTVGGNGQGPLMTQ